MKKLKDLIIKYFFYILISLFFFNLSFSKDIRKVLTQIKRISGGDFLSAGGTHGFLWENYLHKTYDKKLNYLTHPFDFREDSFHKSKTLVGKEVLELEFMKL